jgi:ABC-2 type transport system ATP-binding protein
MIPAINIQHVTRRFGTKTAVKELSLTVQTGSVFALLGPNGAGKTTLISMLLGLLAPSSGSLQLLGQPAGTPAVKARLGAMLQDQEALDGLTVRETIELFRAYYPKPLPLAELLAAADLTAEANQLGEKLSGGQKRRLAFALALAGDPEILFLDEPTVGMDVTARRHFWERIRAFKQAGKTIILTTHYLEEADALADRVVVMKAGEIVADGTPMEIKAALAPRTVSFALTAAFDLGALRDFPGVTALTEANGRITLAATDTDALIIALVKAGVPMQGIEIRTGNLDDAFTALTEGVA